MKDFGFSLSGLTMKAAEFMTESGDLVRGLADELREYRGGKVQLKEEDFEKTIEALARMRAVIHFGVFNDIVLSAMSNHDVGPGVSIVGDRTLWLEGSDLPIGKRLRAICDQYEALAAPFYGMA